MKSTILTELPIVPEEYETDCLDDVDWSKIHSLMSSQQRALVNGLIRYYHPENILELGVYRGGGTISILNAIKDRPDSALTSIDLLEYACDESNIPVGDDAKKAFPNLPEDKWKLLTGKDPSEVIDSLGKTFDFAIIDTAHLHPIESLNFLCALPYLRDGAIVVLHDIDLYITAPLDPARRLAPRILFSAVASPKIELKNIGVFQIVPDTRRYIRNIFDALLIPWETHPDHIISSVRKLLEKYYPVDLINKFDRASHLNESYVMESLTFDISVARKLYKGIPPDAIFYGAGRRMTYILRNFDKINVTFDFSIWDQDNSIKEIHGNPVIAPDFKTPANKNSIIIITIDDEGVFNEVRIRLEPLGYTVFHGLEELFKYLKQRGDIN